MSLDHPYSQPDRFFPQALEDRLAGFLSRATGVAILTTVAAVWLSIISWSAADPSLTHTTSGEIRNILGYPGAAISDLMLQTFGIATALIMLAPMFWGLELTFNTRVKDFSAKATYFPLAILIMAGAFSALPIVDGWPLHHGFGGILGDAVFRLGTNLVALAAPNNAGPLTGLAFFAFGFASVAYSVGIELSDIATMIQSRATSIAQSAARAEPMLPSFPRPDFSIAKTWRSKLTGAQPGRYAPENYAGVHHHEPNFGNTPYPETAPTRNAVYVAPAFQPPTSHAPAPAYPAPSHAANSGHQPQRAAPHNPQSRPQPQPHQTAQHYRAPTPTAHAWMKARVPKPAHATPTPQNNSYIGPDETENRGSSFDGLTDRASQFIARRFAPASAMQFPQPDTPDNLAAPRSDTQNFDDNALHATGMPTVASTAPGYVRPSLNLLNRATGNSQLPRLSKTVLRGNARLLEDVLSDFGIKGEIQAIRPGPVVTLFELQPARGTKSARIIGLADDIARSMSAKSARISVVEGRNVIGIELPNARTEPVLLRQIIETDAFRKFQGTLPLALGTSITGDPVVADLAAMPHLLVAGTTGSGKSVGLNAMIASLLYKWGPDQCRMLMIDPKMLELSVFNGIPHLLTPVITDPEEAVSALNWVVGEMEERYKRMSKMNVRNIDIFNNRVKNAKKRGDLIARTVQTGFHPKTGQAVFEQQQMEMETMPYIVVVIDEFADLVAAAGKEVDAAVKRLAQMARAAGIHLIMATQRPSVDVLTGTIKANFPTRISFKVASKVDSRTILNEQGAEQLLGQGDMLFSSSAGSLRRVHGPFVSDDEVEHLVTYLRDNHEPRYIAGITDPQKDDAKANQNSGAADANDDLYERALATVLRDKKASISYLQRRLSIGYNRAADLIERMENEQIVSAPSANGQRTVIASPTD